MYFENRDQAGQILANDLYDEYRYEDCAVVALNDGSVLVGEPIAAKLHCALNMLIIKTIDIPGEGLSFGGISQDGTFTPNKDLSDEELDQYASEYNGYLQEKKREAFQKINRMLGDGGTIDKKLLVNRVVVLVSDGLDSGSLIDVAVDFLKPVQTKKVVIASPTSSIPAVDHAHVLADELHILDVKANFISVDHYYNDNVVPSREEIVKKINQIILNWK